MSRGVFSHKVLYIGILGPLVMGAFKKKLSFRGEHTFFSNGGGINTLSFRGGIYPRGCRRKKVSRISTLNMGGV